MLIHKSDDQLPHLSASAESAKSFIATWKWRKKNDSVWTCTWIYIWKDLAPRSLFMRVSEVRRPSLSSICGGMKTIVRFCRLTIIIIVSQWNQCKLKLIRKFRVTLRKHSQKYVANTTGRQSNVRLEWSGWSRCFSDQSHGHFYIPISFIHLSYLLQSDLFLHSHRLVLWLYLSVSQTTAMWDEQIEKQWLWYVMAEKKIEHKYYTICSQGSGSKK